MSKTVVMSAFVAPKLVPRRRCNPSGRISQSAANPSSPIGFSLTSSTFRSVRLFTTGASVDLHAAASRWFSRRISSCRVTGSSGSDCKPFREMFIFVSVANVHGIGETDAKTGPKKFSTRLSSLTLDPPSRPTSAATALMPSVVAISSAASPIKFPSRRSEVTAELALAAMASHNIFTWFGPILLAATSSDVSVVLFWSAAERPVMPGETKAGSKRFGSGSFLTASSSSMSAPSPSSPSFGIGFNFLYPNLFNDKLRVWRDVQSLLRQLQSDATALGPKLQFARSSDTRLLKPGTVGGGGGGFSFFFFMTVFCFFDDCFGASSSSCCSSPSSVDLLASSPSSSSRSSISCSSSASCTGASSSTSSSPSSSCSSFGSPNAGLRMSFFNAIASATHDFFPRALPRRESADKWLQPLRRSRSSCSRLSWRCLASVFSVTSITTNAPRSVASSETVSANAFLNAKPTARRCSKNISSISRNDSESTSFKRTACSSSASFSVALICLRISFSSSLTSSPSSSSASSSSAAAASSSFVLGCASATSSSASSSSSSPSPSLGSGGGGGGGAIIASSSSGVGATNNSSSGNSAAVSMGGSSSSFSFSGTSSGGGVGSRVFELPSASKICTAVASVRSLSARSSFVKNLLCLTYSAKAPREASSPRPSSLRASPRLSTERFFIKADFHGSNVASFAPERSSELKGHV
eukprot:PhM_4_TR16027/c0_g1_i1/m.50379